MISHTGQLAALRIVYAQLVISARKHRAPTQQSLIAEAARDTQVEALALAAEIRHAGGDDSEAVDLAHSCGALRALCEAQVQGLEVGHA